MRKYINTDTFVYHNQNPHNRKTDDCVVRALSTATGLSYTDVVLGLVTIQIKTGFQMNCKECYEKWLESLGWEKHKQPRKFDNTKYTGKEFCRELWSGYTDIVGSNRIIAHIGGHHIVAIMDGKVWDTWDSTDGCIGNYWTKK